MKQFHYYLFLFAIILACDTKTKSTENERNKIEISHVTPERYERYVTEDSLFRNSLFIEKGPHYANKHIDVFSTLEYIGEKDFINIGTGIPYFYHTIKTEDGEYINSGFILSTLEYKQIEKNIIDTIRFSKSGTWDGNDPDAKVKEAFFKDPDLRLPAGNYIISGNTAFFIETQNDYTNSTEARIMVIKEPNPLPPIPENYNRFITEDSLFRNSIYVENGPYYSNQHIDVYSTLEYIGKADSIQITSGQPYYHHIIRNDEGKYFTTGFRLDVQQFTWLKRNEPVTIPLSKSGVWDSNASDAKEKEAFFRDPELKLPPGNYIISGECDFYIKRRNDYKNITDVRITVNKSK